MAAVTAALPRSTSPLLSRCFPPSQRATAQSAEQPLPLTTYTRRGRIVSSRRRRRCIKIQPGPLSAGLWRGLLRSQRRPGLVITAPRAAVLGGFGRSCTKMPVEQIWVICAGAVATRLVAVMRSVNTEWTSKAARRSGSRGSRAHSATVLSLVTHSVPLRGGGSGTCRGDRSHESSAGTATERDRQRRTR